MKKEEMIEKMIEEQMTIDLENILPSLAQSLYGNDWRISIRELLQNCNDANIEARIADRNLQPPSLPIRLIPNRDEGTLTIQDEGIGMTLQEVTDYLATVGFGKKRERLEEISRDRKSADYDLIKNIVGKYGIGFLASFIIAKKVEVITKSRVVKDEPAQKCLFSGETKWYHIEHGEDMGPGTIIILHLKGEYKDPTGEIDLLNPAVLEEVVSKFGDLIPYPIYRCEKLDELGTLLNSIQAPWEKDHPMQGEFEDFFSRRFPNSNLPLVIEPFVFNMDQHKTEAKGVLYLPIAGSAVNNQLFVKRVFIKEEFAELLPEWASFVGVIVDCPELTPTLDRNNVIAHEQAFANLKLSLVDLIIEKLIEYAKTRRKTFGEILHAHLSHIQIALITDWESSEEGGEHFFRSLIDYMPFKVLSKNSPAGVYMTLSEYRKKHSQSLIPQKEDTEESTRARDPIFYIHEPYAHVQYETLIIKKNIPVISAHLEAERRLIKAYGGAFEKEVDVKNIRDVLDIYVDPVQVDQAPWECLINYYTELSGGPHTVKAASFEPASMPGVLVVTDIDKQQVEKIEQFMRGGASILTPQLKRQMEEEVKRLMKGDTAFIFYINTNNPLMNNIRRTITEEGRPPSLVTSLLEEVYHNSKIHANAASGVEEHIFEHRTMLLDSVLLDAKELNRLKGEHDKMLIEIKRLKSIEQDQKECIDVSSVPVTPESRYCATLLCDLTKSTWVLANIDFKDQRDIFNRYILEMKSIVEKHKGFFDKFTGDGLLAFFGLKKPDELNDAAERQICMDAKLCAAEITAMTDAFFGQGDVRNVLQRKGIPAPQSCISLAAGEVAFGRFGGTGTAVGIPIVQAARIEAHRDDESHRVFFKNTRIICTEQFLTDLGVGLGEVGNLLLEREFKIEGANPINVYKVPY